MAQGEGGGRPLKFKSVEELRQAINEYFLSCYDYKRDMFGGRIVDKDDPEHTKETPAYIMQKIQTFTITGLAVYLDTTRETLLDYESGKYDDADKDAETNAKFSDTIKKAKLRIYADTENSLYSKSATGAIFSLKNNYGWQDKKEVQHTGDVRVLHQLSNEELHERIEAYRRRHIIDGSVSGGGQA